MFSAIEIAEAADGAVTFTPGGIVEAVLQVGVAAVCAGVALAILWVGVNVIYRWVHYDRQGNERLSAWHRDTKDYWKT